MRLSDAHNEKKRDAMTRGEATFHAFFPNLTDCEIFVPQHQTGAEYSDISRETAIAPAQWKAGGSLVYLRQTETLL